MGTVLIIRKCPVKRSNRVEKNQRELIYLNLAQGAQFSEIDKRKQKK